MGSGMPREFFNFRLRRAGGINLVTGCSISTFAAHINSARSRNKDRVQAAKRDSYMYNNIGIYYTTRTHTAATSASSFVRSFGVVGVLLQRRSRPHPPALQLS